MDDSPADWLRGHDVQLEAAVRYLLDEIAEASGLVAEAATAAAGLSARSKMTTRSAVPLFAHSG